MPPAPRIVRFAVPVLAAAIAVLAPLPAAAAPDPVVAPVVDTSDFEFRSFTAEYELSRAAEGASQVTVTETIVPVFPDFDQNRGIIRAIPDLYQDVPLHTEVQSVTDASGEDVPYEVAWNGDEGFVELALGTDEFVHGEQTYVIEYTQRNVVGTFSDTDADEFYWDVNGTGWDQTFAEVAATVTLDSGLGDALTGNAACYVGGFGDTTQCGIQQVDEGGQTTFTASASGLGPRETMTLAIGFASGTFVPGEPDPDYVSIYQPQAPGWSGVLAIGGLVLSALAVLAAIVLRMLPDGGAPSRGTIIAEYSVPDDLNVMAAAHLVGKPATAISAQLISLAVRRKIRLLDYPVKGGNAEYAVQLLDPTGVDPIEARVLRGLFGELTPGESRDLPKTDTALAKSLQKASKAAANSLRTDGLIEPIPKWLRGGWLRTIAIVLLVVAFLNEFFLVPAGAESPWTFPAIAAAVAALILVGVLARKPTRFTEKGAKRNDYLRGIKLYLEVAEEDRIRMLQSPEGAERVDLRERVGTIDRVQLVKLYERLLPFAVIWGVEKEWMDQLAVRMEEAQTSPDWFAGRNGFSSGAVIGTLHGVGRTASVTSTSSGSWSGSGGSSFSGGSSGGGFSGGGGGGGGGGGR
ncbi:DUF2207 domain-containing protein [Lysobacter korlensis]|uniref:DUF2207 domain-containing protein n=1 Tax=Lysobacter korlensis TaxID=553636 RepID=A0ABV6RY04_9GAMM